MPFRQSQSGRCSNFPNLCKPLLLRFRIPSSAIYDRKPAWLAIRGSLGKTAHTSRDIRKSRISAKSWTVGGSPGERCGRLATIEKTTCELQLAIQHQLGGAGRTGRAGQFVFQVEIESGAIQCVDLR